MGVYAGPDVSESGLVLALDGANYKSFKGEVTTNLISNPTEEISRGEFGQYRDLAPIFDSYGLTPYSLSMDIKVNTPGNVLVYMQNGSYSKYNFVGTSVYCTKEYQRFYFQNITPSISTSWQQNTPDDNRAILATYTGYGSGVNPTVKNIQLEQKSYSTLFVNGTRGDTVATGGGWADMSGNGNHGQLVNGVRESSDSLGALVFDGSNDYVNAPVTKTASCTFSCWAKTTTLSGNPMLFNAGPDGTGPDLFFYSGYIHWNTWDGSNNPFASTPSSVTDGNWHYYVVVNDASSNAKLYYDGVFLGSATYRIASNNTNLTIGGTTGSYQWNGSISNFQVHNRALSAQEVQQNFNATRGRYGI